jgi:general stress protein 26
MEKIKLHPEMIDVLKNSHFSYLCTTDQKNQPHITPMFYVFDENTNDIFITASSNSKKMNNIKANPKIALTIDIRDEMNPFNNHGVMVQGKAIIEKTELTPGNWVPLVSMYLEGQALVEKTGQLTEDEKIAQVSKAFAKKYPVLQEAQSPVNVEAQKFSENLIKIAPEKIVYWKGPRFITVNFNKQKKISA